jgi:3-oxoacyl-[acyl-carrier-protein] synthase II
LPRPAAEACGAATYGEAQAIDAIFSARSRRRPVVAAKSHFGNLGAGSPMIEFIASLLALRHGRLFPILN